VKATRAKGDHLAVAPVLAGAGRVRDAITMARNSPASAGHGRSAHATAQDLARLVREH